jgi:glycosyltransferase involved in cell wall biosynthesis
MKLAVFTGQYFWFDGKHYSTDEAFVKFVTSFYPYFEKIIFCDPVTKEPKTQPYTLDPTKTEVCPLPNFNVYSFWKNILFNFPKICRIFRNNINSWDVVWLHGPHPVSLIFAHICRKLNKPFFVFIRQNLKKYVRYRNRGATRVVAVSVANALEYMFRQLSRNTITFTVGRELFDTYKRSGNAVFEIAVSLVSENDILDSISKQMSKRMRQVRLLSVGRLDPEKGVIHLVRAVGELVANGRSDIRLDIVGNGAEENELRREVRKRDLNGHVNFLGYVSYGDQLLSLYRKCDIYVLPSLTEGWPQTLFEAMACGLPIVATRVGGIPYLIENRKNGLLVDASSPSQISNGVQQIVDDSDLRRRLIENGISTVKSHTMEAERDRVLYRLQEHLGPFWGFPITRSQYSSIPIEAKPQRP